MFNKRPMLRSRRDTNSFWGDLSMNEQIDTRRGLRRAVSRAFLGLIIASVSVALGFGGAYIYNLVDRAPNVTEVIAKAQESIVIVSCEGGEGAGVAVNAPVPNKYKTAIITAAHVIMDCDEKTNVTVTYEGHDYQALVARKDPSKAFKSSDLNSVNDIALLYMTHKIPGLDAAPEAKLGDWVTVIGHPWSETNYASFGIISSVDATEYGTDAAINAGNSGGPLLDNKGRVLGIVSYKNYRLSDIQDGATEVYEYADGMAYAKRLSLSCETLFSNVATCPFADR
ncbi:MAG: hypothetical protein RL085_690 [Actinomycetota bacterium]|jgi:S1-C subfamily serine protease